MTRTRFPTQRHRRYTAKAAQVVPVPAVGDDPHRDTGWDGDADVPGLSLADDDGESPRGDRVHDGCTGGDDAMREQQLVGDGAARRLNIDPHSRTSADKLLAIAAARSARFNRLMEGVPSLLARDGSQTPGALRRHDIPQEAFDRALRAHGLRTVGEVAEARLEPNDKITVIKCSGS